MPGWLCSWERLLAGILGLEWVSSLNERCFQGCSWWGPGGWPGRWRCFPWGANASSRGSCQISAALRKHPRVCLGETEAAASVPPRPAGGVTSPCQRRDVALLSSLCVKLPPCFPLCNGNSLLHSKRSFEKL